MPSHPITSPPVRGWPDQQRRELADRKRWFEDLAATGMNKYQAAQAAGMAYQSFCNRSERANVTFCHEGLTPVKQVSRVDLLEAFHAGANLMDYANSRGISYVSVQAAEKLYGIELPRKNVRKRKSTPEEART